MNLSRLYYQDHEPNPEAVGAHQRPTEEQLWASILLRTLDDVAGERMSPLNALGASAAQLDAMAYAGVSLSSLVEAVREPGYNAAAIADAIIEAGIAPSPACEEALSWAEVCEDHWVAAIVARLKRFTVDEWKNIATPYLPQH